MARITAAEAAELTPQVSDVLDAQKERWGSALEPFRIYARRPSILTGRPRDVGRA